MNRLAVALLVLSFASPALAGGKRCAVGESAIDTPGFREMARGSSSEPVPDDVRLTDGQVNDLYDADCSFRKALAEIDGRFARLPVVKALPGAPAGAALPEMVTYFVARSLRSRALVIDPETSNDFHYARAKVMQKDGTDRDACAVCIAVRRAVEAEFAYDLREFAAGLTEEQKAEIAAIAQDRQSLRVKWAATLKEALTGRQFAWLQRKQERWLMHEVGRVVEAGLRGAGTEVCSSCTEQKYAPKCEFCTVVEQALRNAAGQ